MIDDVIAFHHKFYPGRVANSPTCLTPRQIVDRVSFLYEEVGEFLRATRPDLTTGKPDLAGQADALIDIAYVAIGTAIMLGLPWPVLWDEVHAANMRKVLGPSRRFEDGDVIKPDGWVGPDIIGCLRAAGYEP